MDKLINKYPSNWPKELCNFVNRLKPELQIVLIKYCRTGKL